MHYTKIELEQGSPEWLDFRRSHIGASDAPIIMGVSPWKKIHALYLEKISGESKTFYSNAMRRGNELEEPVRQMVAEKLGIEFATVVLESVEMPYLSASLDGINEEKEVFLEIKCPLGEDHETAREKKVPEKYYPQIQHTFLVTGFKKGYYASYQENDLIIFEVERDDKYIAKMLKEEKAFHHRTITFDAPPNNEGEDFRDNKVWQVLEEQYKVVCFEIDNIKEELEGRAEEKAQIEIEFRELANSESAYGNLVKFTHSKRKAPVNYKAIPELKGVDLDAYRKEPIDCYSFKLKKGD